MLVTGPEPPPPLPRVDGVEHRFVQANGIRIHVVELPIPLVHGMRDFAVGARIQRSGWQQHAPHMTLELVDGASHWLLNEQPHLIVARERQFFSGATA